MPDYSNLNPMIFVWSMFCRNKPVERLNALTCSVAGPYLPWQNYGVLGIVRIFLPPIDSGERQRVSFIEDIKEETYGMPWNV